MGEIITAAIALDVDRPEEEVLTEYRGFQLVLPPRMVYNNPRLIVRGSFDWRTDIDFAASSLGVMAAVDRVLNGFGARALELKGRQQDLTNELNDAQKELARVDNLEEEIEKTRERLAQLDKELGVNEDE